MNITTKLATLLAGIGIATTLVAAPAHADDPYDVCHGTQWFTNCRNPVPPPPPGPPPPVVFPPGTHCIGGGTPCP